jgi:predicted glycosyltransferase involved in capsule biosynthesis
MSNLKSISIVIPFSKSSEERTRNLCYTIEYYKRNLPSAHIIVVEQDTNTEFESTYDKIDKHILVNTNGDFFNRSLLLNTGFNSSQSDFCSDYIIFSDGDCLIEKSVFENIENYYDYFDKYFVIAYKSNMFYLSESETNKFIHNKEDNVGGNCNRDLESVRVTSGGIIILSAQNYYNVGGFDARFRGWGVEDNAFHNKCIVMGISVNRLNGEAVHLSHKNSPKNMDNYENNVKIYNEICNSSNLKEYIDSIGYNHLVKPCRK